MACCQKKGTIVFGNCTCMTGLREACSHIAALLFTVERNTQHQNMTTCTSLPCSRLPPSYHSVNYSEIADIDFATPQLNRTRGESYDFCFTSSLNQCSGNTSMGQRAWYAAYQFFHADKPVLISLTPKYSDHYIPLCVILKPLTHLFDSADFNLLYTELLKKCEEVFTYTSSSSL